MNSRMAFWIPSILRLLVIALGIALLWLFLGAVVGLSVGVLALSILILTQLSYLHRLNIWLDNPDSARLPDGWGAWTDVFSRLYRLRRDDEKHQAELFEWLARFRQAMSLLPDGVVLMDDLLFLEWCNPAAERHLGLQNERDQGMRVTNLIRNPDFMDYIMLGRYEQPMTLALKDRKLVVQIIPFENRRQILVTHDATEADRIEMMRRDFIANASHELRTPLTVINGFLEIALAQPNLDPQNRQSHLKLMSEQGHRMQNLVEDMLTLTRLESIDYPMRPERVAIHVLLESILQEAEALSAGQHAILMEIDGPDIHGSTDELRSAFGNLVSNAVRYTPAGGRIGIKWMLVNASPQLIVQDSGIGIRPEHIPRLTERFYRVDKGRSRETKGTGLGLAIVKHVLLRHHANLVINSALGEGTTFKIKFPATAIYEPKVPSQPQQA